MVDENSETLDGWEGREVAADGAAPVAAEAENRSDDGRNGDGETDTERVPDDAVEPSAMSESDPEGDGDEATEGPGEGADEDDEADDSEAPDADETGDDETAGPLFPLPAVVEALLFAAREPLKAVQLARAVGKGTRQDAVKTAIDELNVHYLETGRSFEIAEISGRYQLMSRPEFADHIRRIYPKRELEEKDKAVRLTPATKETLSIIAYKQPVTRAEIERIRGVGCGPVLKTLIERGTVRVAGKMAEVVGQPLVYGTTESFLVEFGLGSLDELPMRNEFLDMLREAEPAAPIAPVPAETDDAGGDSGDAEDPDPSAKSEPVESEEDTESETIVAAVSGVPSESRGDTPFEPNSAGI